jgi:SAM domain (Sterile alpha motif)
VDLSLPEHKLREGLAVQDIAAWLSSLGLSECAERFAEKGIDVSVLAT